MFFFFEWGLCGGGRGGGGEGEGKGDFWEMGKANGAN